MCPSGAPATGPQDPVWCFLGLAAHSHLEGRKGGCDKHRCSDPSPEILTQLAGVGPGIGGF